MFAVLLRMPGLRRPLRARELSDGTLRYLCLLAALLSPLPPALLALNEPETSLHPDPLEPLAQQLVNAGKYSQLWIVTHSARLAGLVEKFPGDPPTAVELGGGEPGVKGQRLIEKSEEGGGYLFMSASRTNGNLNPTRLSEALVRHKATGRKLLDLTASNPT